jgi:hypothetical protein
MAQDDDFVPDAPAASSAPPPAAPVNTVAPIAKAPDDFVPDNFVPDASAPSAAPSALEKAFEPITSYPSTYNEMQTSARQQIGQGAQQLSSPQSGWDIAKGLGNVGLGTLGYTASPISAALRTVVGRPLEENFGIPKEYSEFAANLALPVIGFTKLPGTKQAVQVARQLLAPEAVSPAAERAAGSSSP